MQDIHTIALSLPLRMGRVNCYLIRDSAGHALIDTGGSNARRELQRELANAGCTPGSLKLVILTHGDFDAIPGLTATGKVARVKPLGENKQGDMTYTVVVQPDQLDARLRWNMAASVAIEPQ